MPRERGGTPPAVPPESATAITDVHPNKPPRTANLGPSSWQRQQRQQAQRTVTNRHLQMASRSPHASVSKPPGHITEQDTSAEITDKAPLRSSREGLGGGREGEEEGRRVR